MEKAYSFEEALTKPELVKRLVLKYGQQEHPPLSKEIKKLTNLEELYIEDFDQKDFVLPDEISSLGNLQHVSFQFSQQLESLPKNLFKVKSIERITTTGLKNIFELDNRINELENLKNLTLGFQLKVIPEGLLSMNSILGMSISFGKIETNNNQKNYGDGLINLGALDLTAVKFEQVPLQMFRSNNFTSLSISVDGNSARIPIDYSKQKKLERLSLKQFKKVDSEVSQLENLKVLNLNGYKSESIDLDFSSMDSIEFLELERTEIESLPQTIGGLKRLKRILMRHSKISVLPIELSELTFLAGIDLQDCTNLDFNALFELVKKSNSIYWLTLKGTNLTNYQISKINKELKKNKI